MPKSLEQLKSYQVHYRRIYPQAKSIGQGVLRSHFKKLSQKIKQLQGNSVIDI